MNAPLQTAEVHVAAKIDMVCFKPAKDMPPHELEAPSNEQKDDKQHSVWGAVGRPFEAVDHQLADCTRPGSCLEG